MSESAILEIKGEKYELPLIEGVEGDLAIDSRKLYETCGVFSLDSGYKNTASTQSNITYLDGGSGVLRYRGYPIEELAQHANFAEVAYLLMAGELPNLAELKAFNDSITIRSYVHEQMRNILNGFPATAHPMGVLTALVSALTAFHPKSLAPDMPDEDRWDAAVDLIAKLPTLAAWGYRKQMGLPTRYPVPGLDYASNFLYMMYALPNKEYEVDPIMSSALDKLLILHADHEQNCSTSTVRMVGSSNASLFSAISAGLCALWGPLHGGANQAVIEMLERIRKDGGNLDKWIARAKDKDDSFRLMGFGHRIYKNFDPRATIIKKAANDVLEKLGIHDPILDLAKKLEETVLQDDYFVSRNLYPNVDFYSGIIYRALGIPKDMFTVMFAIGRLPGWIAQFMEMKANKEPIGRPRQIYTGEIKRSYTFIEKR